MFFPWIVAVLLTPTHSRTIPTRRQGLLRLLTPLKMSYDAAKKRVEPYTKIVEELPQMRRETVRLVRQAVSEGRHAYVLVNNRSEGNAPLTIQILSDRLRHAPDPLCPGH